MTRPSCSLGFLGIFLTVVFLTLPQPATGQVWLQTARLTTPVEQGATRAFFDTLRTVAEQRGLSVQRAPNADSQVSLSAIESTLIEDHGIGLRSANHAYINYHFTIGNDGQFREQVASIQFVFRPGPNQPDVPVLHLEGDNSWLTDVLHNKATSLNGSRPFPFHLHLAFSHVARNPDARILEIGGKTVRNEFLARKRALIQKIERLTHS